jgi:hypothetical protein
MSGSHAGHAPGGPAAEGLLVAAMWSWAGQVLYPAQAARRAGTAPVPAPEGE